MPRRGQHHGQNNSTGHVVDEERPRTDRLVEDENAGCRRRSLRAFARDNSQGGEATRSVDQTGREMAKPPRSNKSNFSKREAVLFVLVMIVATILTVETTNFILKTFVIGNPNSES
jgi:hypothetical protein